MKGFFFLFSGKTPFCSFACRCRNYTQQKVRWGTTTWERERGREGDRETDKQLFPCSFCDDGVLRGVTCLANGRRGEDGGDGWMKEGRRRGGEEENQGTNMTHALRGRIFSFCLVAWLPVMLCCMLGMSGYLAIYSLSLSHSPITVDHTLLRIPVSVFLQKKMQCLFIPLFFCYSFCYLHSADMVV